MIMLHQLTFWNMHIYWHLLVDMCSRRYTVTFFIIRFTHTINHWVQSKRHMLWFLTKICSWYSTKTYVDSLILSSNWIWLRWETNTLKCVWCSMKTTFNLYVSHRSHIQFEDEDHAVYMSFRWVTTSLSSLRTTACDAVIVPSVY